MSLNVSPRNYPLLPLRFHQEPLASPIAVIMDRALEGEGSLAGVGSEQPTSGPHPSTGKQEGEQPQGLMSMPAPSPDLRAAQSPHFLGAPSCS